MLNLWCASIKHNCIHQRGISLWTASKSNTAQTGTHTTTHVLAWCGAVFVVMSEAHRGDAKWAFLHSCGLLQELQGTARVIIYTNRGRLFFHVAKSLIEGDEEEWDRQHCFKIINNAFILSNQCSPGTSCEYLLYPQGDMMERCISLQSDRAGPDQKQTNCPQPTWRQD